MNGNGTPLLELRDVRKSFGAAEAVAGVNAAFGRGEYVCILGPSGCGKTTLLRLVAGFEQPDAGGVLLDGRPLEGVPPERRDVNVVFQSYALFPHLTVRENVAFGPRMKRLPAPEARERVEGALRLARLHGFEARRPSQLSGGQQQRVALARALANRPRILLLDEPLSALDRSLRLEMQDELRALQKETGVTFLHVTHDQGEALSLSHRLVVMREGRFAQVGPPGELYHRPRSRFVAEFLGSSNLLEGTLEGGVVVTTGGLRLPVREPGRPEGPVLACIRPEAIALELGGGRDAPHLDRFAGRVQATAFTGALLECRVAVGGHVLRVAVPARPGAGAPEEGAAVTLEFPPEGVVLLDPGDAAAR